MHCTKSCGRCLGARIFIGSAHVKVWIGLDLPASDDFCKTEKIQKKLQRFLPKLRYILWGEQKHPRSRCLFRIGCRNLGKIAGFVAEISSIPTKVLWQVQKKTRRWTQNCGVRWYNFDPRASFWMAMLQTLPCFMCFVFQSNWNSHFGAYLWSFWCWKRVLKSKTSICKVLQIFKSVFLEEQKTDPAEFSGSFPETFKRNSQLGVGSQKISFASVKIHDVFQPNFW